MSRVSISVQPPAAATSFNGRSLEGGIGLLLSEPHLPLAPRYSTAPAGQCAECWYGYRPATPGEAVRVRGRVVRLCQACQREVEAGGWGVTAP